MAVTAIHQATVADGTNLTSYPSDASRTPTANKLSVAVVVNAGSSATPTTPTVSGNGLTWSQYDTYICDTVNPAFRITLFVAKNGASPSAGIVTADFGGISQLGAAMLVDEIDGSDVSGTALQAIVQGKRGSADATGNSESITMDNAIGSGNASYAVFHIQHANTFTPGDGHSILGDDNHTGPVSHIVSVFKSAGSQTVSGSWANTIGKGGLAIEIKAASSGISVTITQVTETNTAQTLGRTKSKAITVVLETNTAQTLASRKSAGITQVSETNLAQTLGIQKRSSIAQITETNTAQELLTQTIVAIEQVVEVDTSQSLGAQKVLGITQVSEVDTAQSLTSQKSLSISQILETNLAQNLGAQIVVGITQVSETDLAQALFPRKQVSIVQVTEIDVAQQLTSQKIESIATVLEVNLAQTLTQAGPISATIVQILEINLAQPFSRPGVDFAVRYVYTIAVENRTYIIPPEDRVYIVPNDLVQSEEL